MKRLCSVAAEIPNLFPICISLWITRPFDNVLLFDTANLTAGRAIDGCWCHVDRHRSCRGSLFFACLFWGLLACTARGFCFAAQEEVQSEKRWQAAVILLLMIDSLAICCPFGFKNR